MTLRILLLTSAYPPVMGGAETYAQRIAEGLAARGNEVRVVTDAVREGTGQRTDSPGTFGDRVRVDRLADYRALIDDPSKLPWEQMLFGLLPELSRTLGDWRPDAVFSNSLETAVLGRIAADEYGVPLVSAFHEHEPETEPFGAGRCSLVYRWVRPDLVLAGSEFYADRARAHVPEDRIALIHHGVDTDAFAPADVRHPERARLRRKWEVADDELLIVSVGRLKPRKGQAELLRAFTRLTGLRAVLLLLGGVSSGSLEYADRLRADVDIARADGFRVVLDEGVTLDRMPAVLAACDMAVLPSHSEGLGLALLEAMSAALPVIATDIAGFAEILDGSPAAITVPLGDEATLAQALSALASDSRLRKELGALARARVVEHFSTRGMTTRTLDRLRDVIGRAR
ncbi:MULTISPECIES: glycosyltransferase family 4 protein [unclassified Streptomyces]|uniref:glycosyltransferase family 4 protein n=1 Tax=unclassified Streptomyces TaxID=2593676 RepID=UPI003428A384